MRIFAITHNPGKTAYMHQPGVYTAELQTDR